MSSVTVLLKDNINNNRMKLISIKPSTTANKKMTAIFLSDAGTRIVHFGQKGAQDFTTSGDEAKKAAYLKRHQPREDWNNPITAGALSRWVLWNKPTIKASIADYKQRFKL
jgi:hypothetical protein